VSETPSTSTEVSTPTTTTTKTTTTTTTSTTTKPKAQLSKIKLFFNNVVYSRSFALHYLAMRFKKEQR